MASKNFLTQYPESGLASKIIIPADDYIWVPSKSPVINYNLGGGIPMGKMVEFLGEESSGKSLLAYDFMKSAQELGGMGILVDAEFSFEERWAKLNGLDLDKIHYLAEVAVEKIQDFLHDAATHYRSELRHNEPIVIVVDSLAALDTELALGTAAMDAKAEMGNRAKAIYRMVRHLNPVFSKLGIIAIFVNQIRDAVGVNAMFADTETSPGGKAMRFYAAQRIGLYTGAQINEGTGVNRKLVGKQISFRIKKNKVARPRAPHKTNVIFDPSYGEVGFSKIAGLREVLLELETIEKRGNAYYFDGEEIASGKDDFNLAMGEEPELLADILDASSINTIEKTQEKIDEEHTNLFPV